MDCGDWCYLLAMIGGAISVVAFLFLAFMIILGC